MNLCLDASGGSVKSQFSYVSGHRVNQYGYCSTLYGSEGIMNLRMMRQLDNGFIRIYRDLQVVIKRRTRRLFLFGKAPLRLVALVPTRRPVGVRECHSECLLALFRFFSFGRLLSLSY